MGVKYVNYPFGKDTRPPAGGGNYPLKEQSIPLWTKIVWSIIVFIITVGFIVLVLTALFPNGPCG